MAHAQQLYDAVGEFWLRFFGPHIHVGLYEDRGARDRPTWGAAQAALVDALLCMSGLKSADRLIDIGCGHGATALRLAERLGCRAVAGVNISEFQVAHAAAAATARGWAPDAAQFVVADGARAPFADASFDAVATVESAAYMRDKRAFVREIARLLAPGGRVLMSDFMAAGRDLTKKQRAALAAIDRNYASAGNWTSLDEYKELFAEHGLEVVATADWTAHIRGFWDLGAVEMLLRRDDAMAAATEARSPLANLGAYAKGVADAFAYTWAPVLKACNYEPMRAAVVGFCLRNNARVMQRAFGGGALRYHGLVAVRRVEAAAAPAAVLRADGDGAGDGTSSGSSGSLATDAVIVVAGGSAV